ncbi:MAG: hypothetical protein U0L61_05575 [Alistipes sp.]|nr:hypothetical protein [Alistipes sp.]
MKKLFYFLLALPLVFAACEKTPSTEPGPEPGPEPQPTPEVLTFGIEVGEVTHSVINYTVTPSDLEAEYLCVLYDAETVEEYTRDEFLVQTLLQDLEAEARATGKTLEEYMPEVVDKGVIDSKFERLAPEASYYIVVFGVDAAKDYKASSDVFKTKVTTLAAPKVEVSFEINTTVNGNSAEYQVIPSDKEVIWYFYTIHKPTYDNYTDPAGQYQMDDRRFILLCLENQLSQLQGAGYSAQQIIDAIFHRGDLTLMAKDLIANEDYVNLVAAFDITEQGEISIISDVTTSTYTTGDVKASDLTLEVSVTDVTIDRAAIKITPSDDKQTFHWMCAAWDGKQTAEEIMNDIVAMYGSWMNAGMMLYSGVQDYTGGPGSSYKYKLDAPDTDYYVIAFGYAGGVTTAPVMKTFRTLPAPPAEDTIFTMSASNISPYGFKVGITTTEPSTYYTVGVCTPEEYDETLLVAEIEAGIEEMLAMQQEHDPNFTIANLLGLYFYKGPANIDAAGMTPETEFMGYILALDHNTGKVARVHTFENLATTLAVGSVTPSIELVGYYSGDEENGSVFGQPAATKGKAITVVKYANFDGARSLFATMLGDNLTNAATYSDTLLWKDAAPYWDSVKTAQPYSFYVAEWDYEQTALAYAVDQSGLPGGIGRLYTLPTAENKGEIADLKTLVDELNSAKTFSLPQSVVIADEGITLSATSVENNLEVVETSVEPKAEMPSLNNNMVMVGNGVIRPFYM